MLGGSGHGRRLLGQLGSELRRLVVVGDSRSHYWK